MTNKIYLNQVLPVEIFRIIDEYLFYDLYNERIVSHYRWQKVLSDEESSDSDVSCKLCHYCREYFMCKDINLKYYLCDSCSKYHERCNFLLMLGKHSLQMNKIKIPEYLEIWRGEKENWYFKEGVSTTDKIKFWKKKEKEDKIREKIYSDIKSKRGNSYITAIDALRVEKMVTSMVDVDDSEQEDDSELEYDSELEIPRGTIAELGFDTVDELRANFERWHSEEYGV